ncbi:hypothetical protein AXG93_3256s1730 [Marchantia polymorpha subsp. ruderalis]|uniref:Uncharacterized protein n=1 Tax=Marchantia polymorpha subsp. ruderalis TaxID=1480154 RepID=A0A176VMC4_MARPO|nr:hypothetical protein AXG93_3256s1730 [Marchantia polymorpha subsp. ruderalis]
MVDNRSGVFCLVSATGQVFVLTRVLLGSSAQPLMLGKTACISLGVRRSAEDTPVYEEVEEMQQTRSPAYILVNVPLLGDTRAQFMASVHKVVRVANRSPMALMNRVGQPRMTFPTLVSYAESHAYRDGGPGLLWDSTVHQLMEPNADERERAMGFMTSVTAASSVSEASCCQVLDQAMDLNYLTWIVSLGLAEQRRLRVDLVVVTPFVSSLPTGTVVTMAFMGVHGT